MAKSSPETFTVSQVADMAKAKAEGYGSIAEAAARWGCSQQMVHMVTKGQRRPTPAMLQDLELEPVTAEITYRHKAKK